MSKNGHIKQRGATQTDFLAKIIKDFFSLTAICEQTSMAVHNFAFGPVYDHKKEAL